MSNMSANVDATFHYIYTEIVQQWMPAYFQQFEYTPWVFSLLGSALIGMSGILPLFLIPDIGAGKTGEPFNRKFSRLLQCVRNIV